MIQNFELNIKNIKGISREERKLREKSLELFTKKGFPNKKIEEWKFTDLEKIITKNFKEIDSIKPISKNDKVELIKDFEHNSIILVNGILDSNNFKHEDKTKIKISDHKNENFSSETIVNNSLFDLNNALYEGGYNLAVANNYKFNKPLIVYNYFSDNLNNKIINNKNLITIDSNSSLDIIEFNLDTSKNNFIQNNFTNIKIGENSSLKNYTIQGCKSRKFYYKFVKSFLSKKSNYENYIFASGLKFNKIDEEVDINGEKANCTIKSALFLDTDCHQEIRTQLNHLKPNCTSYQKIKDVLNKNSKSE